MTTFLEMTIFKKEPKCLLDLESMAKNSLAPVCMVTATFGCITTALFQVILQENRLFSMIAFYFHQLNFPGHP